ncbi:MAG: hypothetical protein WDZ76_04030 [Pseudohongiellaceae bacterium]
MRCKRLVGGLREGWRLLPGISVAPAATTMICALLVLPASAQITSIPDSWVNNYDHARIESLLEIGQELQENHDYDGAEAEFDQALQLSRVSEGLYNPRQFDIVGRLLEVLMLQENWPEFDQQLAYLEALSQQNYGNDRPAMIDAVDETARWYRAAAVRVNDSRGNWYLIRAKHLNWIAVTLAEREYGRDDSRLAPLLYQVVLDHYYQSVSNQRRGMTSYEYRTLSKTPIDGWSQTRYESVKNSYRIGKEVLQRIRGIYASTGEATVTDALLLMQLADWELLFGYGDRALQLYADVHEELVLAGVDQADIDAYFMRTTILPEPVLVTELPDAADKGQSPVRLTGWSKSYPGAVRPQAQTALFRSVATPDNAIRLRLEITANYQSSSQIRRWFTDFEYSIASISTLDDNAGGDVLLRQAYEEVAEFNFRPRFSGGKLVPAESVILEYTPAGLYSEAR